MYKFSLGFIYIIINTFDMSEPPLPSARRQLLLARYGPILITPFFFGFSTHVLAPTSLSRLISYSVTLSTFNSRMTGLMHPRSCSSLFSKVGKSKRQAY